VTAGTRIQDRIKSGLERAGQRTGTGPYICTIRRTSSAPTEPKHPWEEPADPANTPTDYAVTAVESIQDIREMTGTLVGVQKRTLTIDATGVAPLKSDRIDVGVAPGDVTGSTVFEEIIAVSPLAPGGTALLYELQLAI
jgi:hypothetical protein